MEFKPEDGLGDDFFRIAQEVYSGDLRWIPEDENAVRTSFSPQNPYFKSCEVWVQTQDRDARLVGFFNPSLRILDETVAFFGFWETGEDLEPNRQLFQKMEGWAKAKGAKRIYGPINFTTFGDYRLRLQESQDGPYPGEPYNPPYYISLLADLGYAAAQE